MLEVGAQIVSEPVAAQPDGSTHGGELLDADRAQTIAEALHRVQRDAGGAPLIAHVRRVATAVPREARVVAWLHELLEHTATSEADLLMEGLTTAELRALRLLTRDTDSRSDAIYLAHIEALARARGPGADVAQSVKRADLIDRARHPSIRPDGWSPPYELGLEVLERAATDGGFDHLVAEPSGPCSSSRAGPVLGRHVTADTTTHTNERGGSCAAGSHTRDLRSS